MFVILPEFNLKYFSIIGQIHWSNHQKYWTWIWILRSLWYTIQWLYNSQIEQSTGIQQWCSTCMFTSLYRIPWIGIYRRRMLYKWMGSYLRRFVPNTETKFHTIICSLMIFSFKYQLPQSNVNMYEYQLYQILIAKGIMMIWKILMK